MPPYDGLPLVLRALEDVESASRALRGAAQMQWTSAAADRFRAALDEAHGCVHEARIAVERAVQPVAAAESRLGRGRPVGGAVTADPAGGYRVVGGPGPTVADLEELTFTCRLLEGAADRLDAASWALARASQACDPLSPAGVEARRVLAAVAEGRSSPWRVADHLRQLAAALRRVVELYTAAESFAHRALRVGVVTVAGELGERPLLAAVLGVVGTGIVAAAAGGVVAGSVVRSVLFRRPDPSLP